ncbi:hypothetical protein ACNSOL_10860 [Aliarcobacter lanthieri]|uniref:hypothetical protein n=1 Tax=Aliarcobacter lanthieri TaxID=1355374 RepID=UPI003AAE54FC
MNFYLNTNIFNNLKKDLKKEDVISVFKELTIFINKLVDYESDVIFSQNFFNERLFNDTLFNILNNGLEKDEFSILMRRIDIQCSNSQCSDILEEYLQEDLEINYLNCKEKNSGEDIIGTYIACALYNEMPILNLDKLYQEEHYFNSEIIEIIEDGIADTHKIENLKLSDYEIILNNFNNGNYEQLSTWQDYIPYAEDKFKYIKFTKNCKRDFFKAPKFPDKYIKGIRKQIENLNKFVEDHSGKTMSCANLADWNIRATRESVNRFDHFKDNVLKKKNCSNNNESMDWHAKIDYLRLYFTCSENNIMCFTFFTKKIPNP